MRLQRYLSRCGVASRRNSEKLISDGRVKINGRTVTELGVKIHPGFDRIEVDGSLIKIPSDQVTIALNKPVGYITSMGDPFGRRTVKSLIPIDEHPSLFPVGRLDRDTEGLLLFTTDGDLGNKLLHPSGKIDKEYIVLAKGILDEADIARLEQGIELSDGLTAPAICRIISSDEDTTTVSITIHEGRNRQVRRMFEHIGHPVMELKRIRFASIELDGIETGNYIYLDEEDMGSLLRSLE